MDTPEQEQKEDKKNGTKWTWFTKYIGIPVVVVLLSIGSSVATIGFKSGVESEKITTLEVKTEKLEQVDAENKERSDSDHDILVVVKTKVESIEAMLKEIREDMKKEKNK